MLKKKKKVQDIGITLECFCFNNYALLNVPKFCTTKKTCSIVYYKKC